MMNSQGCAEVVGVASKENRQRLEWGQADAVHLGIKTIFITRQNREDIDFYCVHLDYIMAIATDNSSRLRYSCSMLPRLVPALMFIENG